MRANTFVYIWKMSLTAAAELPNITECGWQQNGDKHSLDESFATEIEELLVDGDDDINDVMEYENGSEVDSDDQQREL